MQIVAKAGSFRQLAPAVLLALGFVLFLAGYMLEVNGTGGQLLDALGLGGTVFGLFSKIGGPMIFAGLFTMAVRRPSVNRAARAETEEAPIPGDTAPADPDSQIDRLSRLAAAATRQAARQRQARLPA